MSIHEEFISRYSACLWAVGHGTERDTNLGVAVGTGSALPGKSSCHKLCKARLAGSLSSNTTKKGHIAHFSSRLNFARLSPDVCLLVMPVMPHHVLWLTV